MSHPLRTADAKTGTEHNMTSINIEGLVVDDEHHELRTIIVQNLVNRASALTGDKWSEIRINYDYTVSVFPNDPNHKPIKFFSVKGGGFFWALPTDNKDNVGQHLWDLGTSIFVKNSVGDTIVLFDHRVFGIIKV